MKHWTLLVAALLGLALGWLLFRGHPADTVILAGADSTLADTKPAAARRDTIRVTVRRIVADTHAVNAAEREADADRATAEVALAALAAAQTAADSLPPLVAALTAQTRRADLLDIALTLQRDRFARLVSADSAYHVEAEARITRLGGSLATVTRELHRARASGPCSVGTVSAGWNPLDGRAAIVLGGSCRVLPLLRAVF